jgi:hypothetical protein
MSSRGSQTRPKCSSALHRNRRSQTLWVTVRGRSRLSILVVVTARGVGRIAAGIVILLRSRAAVRPIKQSSPGFSLACSVTRFGAIHAPGGTASLCFVRWGERPRGFGSSHWAPSKKARLGTWEHGPLAQASPMGDPANPGIHLRRLDHV